MSKITLSLKMLETDFDSPVDFYALTIEQEDLSDGGCHVTFPVEPKDEPSDVMARLHTAVDELSRHVLDITKK